jgi:hypothetical protein
VLLHDDVLCLFKGLEMLLPLFFVYSALYLKLFVAFVPDSLYLLDCALRQFLLNRQARRLLPVVRRMDEIPVCQRVDKREICIPKCLKG